MTEVLFGILVIFLLIVGIGMFARSPRGMEKEAAEEAAKESPEELRQAITKPKQTPEEVEKENDLIVTESR